MMTDLGRQSVMLAWVSNIFRFWNSIVNLGQQHILYQVLCEKKKRGYAVRRGLRESGHPEKPPLGEV